MRYLPVDMSPRGIPVVPRSKRSTMWQPRPSRRSSRALSLQGTLSVPLVETREEATDIVDGMNGLSPSMSAKNVDTIKSPSRPRSMSISPFHTPDGRHSEFNDSIERVESSTLLAYYDTPSVGHFPSFDVGRPKEETEGSQMEIVREKCQEIDDVRTA